MRTVWESNDQFKSTSSGQHGWGCWQGKSIIAFTVQNYRRSAASYNRHESMMHIVCGPVRVCCGVRDWEKPPVPPPTPPIVAATVPESRMPIGSHVFVNQLIHSWDTHLYRLQIQSPILTFPILIAFLFHSIAEPLLQQLSSLDGGTVVLSLNCLLFQFKLPARPSLTTCYQSSINPSCFYFMKCTVLYNSIWEPPHRTPFIQSRDMLTSIFFTTVELLP